MSRTTITDVRTGEEYPQKTDKKRMTKANGKGDKKFFGYRHGDGSDPNAVKGKDFLNYGYPDDLRCRAVKRQNMADKITEEELEFLKWNNVT